MGFRHLRVYAPIYMTATLHPDPAAGAVGRLPCTCFTLRKMARIVSRLYDQHLAAVGLKTTQYSLLKCVQHAALPVAQLALLVGVERTTATRNLKPLIEAGWVALLPGADSRQRIATITDAGRAKAQLARAAWRNAQAELELALGREAVRALHEGLDFAMLRLAPLLDEPQPGAELP